MNKQWGALAGAVLAIVLAGCDRGDSGVVVTRAGKAEYPFADTVWAGDTLYLSGKIAPPDLPGDKDKGVAASYTSNTKAQSENIFRQIEEALKAQGLGMGDVVRMEVFLVGDPKLGGAMDFAGMNAAYRAFFGTPEQPNKPVRAAVQVAGLAVPGALVEIMVTAVRTKK